MDPFSRRSLIHQSRLSAEGTFADGEPPQVCRLTDPSQPVDHDRDFYVLHQTQLRPPDRTLIRFLLSRQQFEHPATSPLSHEQFQNDGLNPTGAIPLTSIQKEAAYGTEAARTHGAWVRKALNEAIIVQRRIAIVLGKKLPEMPAEGLSPDSEAFAKRQESNLAKELAGLGKDLTAAKRLELLGDPKVPGSLLEESNTALNDVARLFDPERGLTLPTEGINSRKGLQSDLQPLITDTRDIISRIEALQTIKAKGGEASLSPSPSQPAEPSAKRNPARHYHIGEPWTDDLIRKKYKMTSFSNGWFDKGQDIVRPIVNYLFVKCLPEEEAGRIADRCKMLYPDDALSRVTLAACLVDDYYWDITGKVNKADCKTRAYSFQKVFELLDVPNGEVGFLYWGSGRPQDAQGKKAKRGPVLNQVTITDDNGTHNYALDVGWSPDILNPIEP